MAARPEKTKRSGIAEILQAFKKNKTDKEAKSWDWANKDLVASFGLHEGDKICVKYEYEDIIFVEQDSSDETNDPQVQDADVNCRRRSPLKGDQEEVPIAADENNRSKSSSKAAMPGATSSPISRREDDRDSESCLKPGEYVCGSKIVWWPAVIERYYDQASEEKFCTVREVYEKLRSELGEAQREKIESLLGEKGHSPVWQLKYEARDTTASETLPVFFMSNDSLMHLHPQWAEGTFKAMNRISDPSELADEPIVAGQTALEYAMIALQKSLNSITESADNLEESEEESDDAEPVGEEVLSETINSQDPALKAAEVAVMTHFADVLRSFSKELVANETECVSPDDVWKFFSSLKLDGQALRSKIGETETAAAENQENNADEMKRGVLESDPFPLPGAKNSPSAADLAPTSTDPPRQP